MEPRNTRMTRKPGGSRGKARVDTEIRVRFVSNPRLPCSFHRGSKPFGLPIRQAIRFVSQRSNSRASLLISVNNWKYTNTHDRRKFRGLFPAARIVPRPRAPPRWSSGFCAHCAKKPIRKSSAVS